MDRLEHIHASLALAIRTARGDDAFDAPVTVAEIYQDLVPYRAVRTQLGFDMNADYEHTLLRLLAGESDLARLEPPEARKELRSELGAANPNVGLFRKFAGCDVWITRPRPDAPIVDAPEPEPASALGRDGDAWESRSALWMDPSAIPHDDPEQEDVREIVPEDESEEEAFELLLDDAIEIGDSAPEAGPESLAAEEELVLADPVDDEPPAAPRPPKSEEPVLSTTVSSAGAASAAAPGRSACAFCDSSLPKGRAAKYCPFCGADQSLVPCGSCGEALEPDWRFCIACGADGPSVASARA